MRAFAEDWPDDAIAQAMLAQITRYQNPAILEKLSAADDRIWCAKATIQHGWSRNALVHQIESGRIWSAVWTICAKRYRTSENTGEARSAPKAFHFDLFCAAVERRARSKKRTGTRESGRAANLLSLARLESLQVIGSIGPQKLELHLLLLWRGTDLCLPPHPPLV